METFLDIIKGMLIGIANIIPGVSGGTMAVSLGVYDKLIASVADFFKQWKKSVKTLLPIGIGVAIGIIFFTYAVEFLLRQYPFPTVMAFLGLIVGGIPMLWREYRTAAGGRIPSASIIAFVAMFCLSALLPLMQAGEGSGEALGGSLGGLILLFFLGVIASATMVIPGISGSMVLMILGYYYQVIGLLKSFFEAVRSLDPALALKLAIPLVFLGVGILVGIFLISKCIRFLFARCAAATYGGILGLIAASPVAIFQQTGARPQGLISFMVGVAVLAACFFAAYLPNRKQG